MRATNPLASGTQKALRARSALNALPQTSSDCDGSAPSAAIIPVSPTSRKSLDDQSVRSRPRSGVSRVGVQAQGRAKRPSRCMDSCGSGHDVSHAGSLGACPERGGRHTCGWGWRSGGALCSACGRLSGTGGCHSCWGHDAWAVGSRSSCRSGSKPCGCRRGRSCPGCSLRAINPRHDHTADSRHCARHQRPQCGRFRCQTWYRSRRSDRRQRHPASWQCGCGSQRRPNANRLPALRPRGHGPHAGLVRF